MIMINIFSRVFGALEFIKSLNDSQFWWRFTKKKLIENIAESIQKKNSFRKKNEFFFIEKNEWTWPILL